MAYFGKGDSKPDSSPGPKKVESEETSQMAAAELEEGKEISVLCPKCGNEVGSDMRFCPHCGSKL
jgi:uncharacterized OB-fold protein